MRREKFISALSPSQAEFLLSTIQSIEARGFKVNSGRFSRQITFTSSKIFASKSDAYNEARKDSGGFEPELDGKHTEDSLPHYHVHGRYIRHMDENHSFSENRHFYFPE